MKLFLVFALLLAPLLASSQPPLPAPALLYQEAFQHIKADPSFLEMQGKNGCVAVFDSIVHQSQSLFLEALGKRWGYADGRNMNQLLDSLHSFDRSSYHKPYYSPITASLTTASGAEKGCLVIMFSRLNNNMLLAEVTDNQEGGPGRKSVISTFDQSILYLLVFGPDGKIQKSYTQVLNYN